MKQGQRGICIKCHKERMIVHGGLILCFGCNKERKEKKKNEPAE